MAEQTPQATESLHPPGVPPPALDASLYLLPGYGGQLDKGLGRALLDRGYNLAGRMTVGPFKHLPFTEQVQVVAQDLVEHFWSSHAQVVANSFGAYLFLHAQALLAPFPGRVLLLSPIVGDFEDESSGQHFSPPQPEKLKTLVQTGEYHRPDHCEIHVGEHDWQSNPYNVSALGVRLSLPVHVVPGNGHRLDPVYVGQVLDRWLQRPGGEPR